MLVALTENGFARLKGHQRKRPRLPRCGIPEAKQHRAVRSPRERNSGAEVARPPRSGTFFVGDPLPRTSRPRPRCFSREPPGTVTAINGREACSGGGHDEPGAALPLHESHEPEG